MNDILLHLPLIIIFVVLLKWLCVEPYLLGLCLSDATTPFIRKINVTFVHQANVGLKEKVI